MSHHIHHTDAFVLGAVPSGESNKMVSFLTEELGYIQAIATNVRAEKSKLRYSLQPYCWTRIALVRGRDIWRVTGADCHENIYYALDDNEYMRGMLFRVSSLLRRLLHGEGRNDALYELLQQTTKSITEYPCTPEEGEAFECLLVMRILMTLGYMPVPKEDFLQGIESHLHQKEFVHATIPHRKAMITKINTSLEASQL